MESIDKTGQPRSKEDIEDAKQAVLLCIVHMEFRLPPKLLLALPTILDALKRYPIKS